MHRTKNGQLKIRTKIKSLNQHQQHRLTVAPMKLHRRPKERHFGYACGGTTDEWDDQTEIHIADNLLNNSVASTRGRTPSQPSSAYINLFHRLYSFYCTNDLLWRNLLAKHNSTPCCCLRWQRLLVIKDGRKQIMTSLWKRSISNKLVAVSIRKFRIIVLVSNWIEYGSNY